MVRIEDIKPLADRVLVRPVTKEEKTVSGIIIPDTAAKEKPEQGTVLAKGPGEKNDAGVVVPVAVEVGDTVMFTKYSPNEIEIDGEDLLIIREKDILAVVKRGE